MATIFSETLIKLRAEAGFPTAYRFFHDNGGQPVLGLSYRRYLLIEQGKNHPFIDKLKNLFYGLRLVPQSPNANALVVAWLKTMAGEEIYHNLLRPVIAPKAETKGVSPLHKVIEKNLSDNKYHMTPEQFETVLTNFDTYLCHHALLSETGAWAVADLAKALQLTAVKTKAALKILAKAKLVKEVRPGAYKSPLAAYTIVTPQLNISGRGQREKMERYHRELVATGRNEWHSTCLLRADAAVFKGYSPVLNLAIHTAGVYEVKRKTDHSAMFLVEGHITKLRDF